MQIFFLAMTLYPEVYKRLQEEVDRVVGHDRLPSFADRPHLPYVSAVIKETLRWQTILPSGTPILYRSFLNILYRMCTHEYF